MMWLDSYERRTRLAPGLLALLPIAFSVIGFGIDKAPVVSSVLGLLSAAGGAVLLANTVRVLGLNPESSLNKQWGGRPTTRFLRLSDTTIAPTQKTQWRSRLSTAAGVALPTDSDEARDLHTADEAYDTLTAHAREATRDHNQFGLVFAENKNYGFERNLLGLQRVGIFVSAANLGLCLAAVLIQLIGGGDMSPGVASALAINAVCLLGWVAVPSERRVKLAAEKYANQLFMSATKAS